jgi:hypothetical protein
VLDSYVVGQPVRIRASCSKEGTVLSARISDAVTNREAARGTLQPAAGGLYEADLAPLAEGLYRIAVSSKNVAVSATDVFLVAGP